MKSMNYTDIATPKCLQTKRAEDGEHPLNLDKNEDELDYLYRDLDKGVRQDFRDEYRKKKARELAVRYGWNYEMILGMRAEPDQATSKLPQKSKEVSISEFNSTNNQENHATRMHY